MESKETKNDSMNRCMNFVQNTELSNESKDYLVCLGMVEDLEIKMHGLLLRDWGEEPLDDGKWDEWREATEQVKLFIMGCFKDRIVMNLGDLIPKVL